MHRRAHRQGDPLAGEVGKLGELGAVAHDQALGPADDLHQHEQLQIHPLARRDGQRREPSPARTISPEVTAAMTSEPGANWGHAMSQRVAASKAPAARATCIGVGLPNCPMVTS